MWDVKSIGKQKYVAAEPIKQNDLVTQTKFVLHVLIDVIWTLMLLVLVSIKGLIGLFIPTKPKNISGKLALVTGGGNGLGRSISERLAREGCNVAIIDLDLINAQNVAKELCTRYGVKSKAYLCDVTDYDKLEKCRDSIKADLGTVNILVNNAGVVPYVSFREKHWTDVDKILKINLNSHIWATRIFLDDMINSKDGHIIAVSSMASKVAAPYLVTYSAAKCGVNGFMNCLAEELWIEGHNEYIKTTTVCPYCINTRKDSMEVMKLRFPPLEPQETANRIVEAMLYEEEQVLIITSPWFTKLAIHLPTSAQRLAADIVFKAKTSRIVRTE